MCENVCITRLVFFYIFAVLSAFPMSCQSEVLSCGERKSAYMSAWLYALQAGTDFADVAVVLLLLWLLLLL